MKAMLLEKYGNGFEFVQREVAKPTPSPGEVLIRVAGTSFNPIDNKIATMGESLAFAPALPALLGMDVSGVIEEIGSGMSRFAPGDKVYGCVGGYADRPGALAEYLVADERLIARAPENMDLVDAAALPLVTITAWLGLFTKAAIQPGETLLVQGGAGGVGHLAVQLGIYGGGRVYATVSDDTKASIVESLGATPINYRENDVSAAIEHATDGRGFDLVFDTVGGPVLDRSFEAAAVGGKVISTNTRSSHDLGLMHGKSLSLHVVFMLLPMLSREAKSLMLYSDILAKTAELVERDRLAVLIDENRFDCSEIADVHHYWASGSALGKIVMTVGG